MHLMLALASCDADDIVNGTCWICPCNAIGITMDSNDVSGIINMATLHFSIKTTEMRCSITFWPCDAIHAGIGITSCQW